MAQRKTEIQKVNAEFKNLVKRLYPNETMPKATEYLARDIFESAINGKDLREKFRKLLNEKK